MTNLEDPVPKIDILSSAILSVKVRHKYLHEKKFSAAGKKALLTCMFNPWKSSVTTPRPFPANQSPCNTWNLFILGKKHGFQKLPDEGNRSLRTHGKLHQQWELC